MRDINALLRKRAAELARADVFDHDEQLGMELVEVALAGERYGIETRYIKEVQHLDRFTELPCTPPYVFGIMSIRGMIVSVLDIRTFFDFPVQDLTEQNKVVILENEQRSFGILVDEVIGVQQVPINEIRMDLDTLEGKRKTYFTGITPQQVIVLDARKLLIDDSLIVHEQA